MKPEERNQIRLSIKAEIKKLEQTISSLTELAESEVQSDANDWFSSKESNVSKEVNDIALVKAKQSIRILDEVLKRIDSPDFGICIRCGKEIPFERMQAVPTARSCVNC